MFVEPPAAQTHEQAALFPVQRRRPLRSRRGAPGQRYGVCRPHETRPRGWVDV